MISRVGAAKTHDLGHLARIARGMATRYAGEVGARRADLPVLDR